MGAFGKVAMSGLLPIPVDEDEKKKPTEREQAEREMRSTPWLTLMSQSDGKELWSKH